MALTSGDQFTFVDQLDNVRLAGQLVDEGATTGDILTVQADGSISAETPGGGGTVDSVTAADGSIVIGGTAADPTVATGALNAIASAHPPVAALAMNAQKITGLANGAAASDAAAFGQIPTALPTTQSLDQIAAAHVTAADWSNNAHKITALAAATASTDAASLANTLDQFGAPAANVAFNSKKITGLANGAAASDALAFGQVFAAGAIPIADIADPTTGKVIGSAGSAAAAVFPPGFEIGYTEITATANITDTAENTATALITAGPFTFDGAAVLAIFYTPAIQSGNAAVTNLVTVTLWEGATEIGRLATIRALSTTTDNEVPTTASYRFTPSAGSHTYKICAFATSTTGGPAITAGAGGTNAYLPAYLRFVKV